MFDLTFYLANTSLRRFYCSNGIEKIWLGTKKIVPNVEVFQISTFESREVTYKSFLRNFHLVREIVPIKEMFELWKVDLQRVIY